MLAIEIPQDADDLTPSEVIGLPVAITTSAWLAGADDGLHLLVGQPEYGAATHLLMRPGAAALTALPPLSLVPAGMVCGPDGLIVTGADATGAPLVVGVSPAGAELWRCALDGPPPIRWPAPLAMPEPAVVWQVAKGRIEIASIDNVTLRDRESLAVGGPPLAIAGGASRLWAAWTEGHTIRAVARGRGGVECWTAAKARAGAVVIGAGREGAWMAWSAAGRTSLSVLAPEGGGGGDAIDLGRAAGGALAVAPGPFPVVWAQHAGTNDRGDRTYVSALARPGRPPILFDGLVHAVAWWGGQLAVLGDTDLWLLASRRVGG